MTTALRVEEMMVAAKVPADKARAIAEAVNKSLKEDFVSHAELKLSHQDVMHAVQTQGADVKNHVALEVAALTHKIEKAFLRSTVTLGSIVVVGLGIFLAILKAFP